MSLAENAILLLGAQRSGTTWLGKIFDSHPDVLYRHEPDHGRSPPRHMDAASLHTTLESWIGDRSQRTAVKRPFFRKSWQSAPAFWLRFGIIALLAAGGRLPIIGASFARMQVPDLRRKDSHPRVAIKSIDWCNGVGDFARNLPHSRTIVILRHPCGQVASVMRGNAQGRFSLRESGTDMPFDEAATVRFAGEHGVDETAFQVLPDAAKYAWAWRTFNETILRDVDGLPNVRLVVYEDLCKNPAEIAQDLLRFCSLDWNDRTAAFIAGSTLAGHSDAYYAVFRNSIAAAERWRTSMPAADQAAVLSVVLGSPLARFWHDLTGN